MDSRILTIDSLIEYCEKNNFSHFSAKEIGKPLVVNTFGNISFAEDKDPSLMSVTLKACHCGVNRNNSKITEKVMKKAFPTFANKPILAEIITDENGEKDFGSHAFTIETDEDGNKYTHYIESPVGIIPETNNIRLEYDKEQDKTYTIVDGYIFNYYGNETSEIIKRKNGTKVSVELEIYDMSWSGKDKVLVINDFSFAGITLLGESVGEGMLGSRLDIADFSKKYTVDYSEQLFEMQERLKKLESCFNINNSNRKEETRVEMNENFDEVTETEKVTETEETTEEEVTVTENESEETVDETSEDETVDEENSEEATDESDEETEDEESTVKEDNACGGGGSGTTKKKKKNNSIECSYEVDGETKKFAVSLQEKIYAIQDLVNATYAEADNTYYGVSVYEDYVVMCDYWSGRYYKQSYTSENDNYSLTGDRVEVYAEFVTSDEQKELDVMRSNYASLKEFKETAEKNELHAKREEILNSEKYEAVSETEAFKELVKNMDNYSLEELDKEAKIIFADNFNMETFAACTEKAQKNSTVKVFANVNKSKKDSRYGNLFSK